MPVAASGDVVQVNVRANELRDSPLQRGGILSSKNVWVNVHELNPVASDRVYTAGGLLEVSGWLGQVDRPIDQRLTMGGTVVVYSTGDVVLRLVRRSIFPAARSRTRPATCRSPG